MIKRAPHTLLLIALATLTGCAVQPSAETGAESQAAQPSQGAPDQASRGAGARPIVRPAERSTPRLDPGMTSQGATALAEPAPPVNAAIPPSTPDEWQPEWYTGSVARPDSGDASVRVGSTVATHRNLLEARRLAVAAAFGMLEDGAIDQTVTRQLDDGRFRVWVRIVQSVG